MERIKETSKTRSTTREINSEKQRGETAVENVNERVAGPAKQKLSKNETISRTQNAALAEKESNEEKDREPEAERKVQDDKEEDITEEKNEKKERQGK